jgi:DNA-binding MarR family transcriptional regulator
MLLTLELKNVRAPGLRDVILVIPDHVRDPAAPEDAGDIMGDMDAQDEVRALAQFAGALQGLILGLRRSAVHGAGMSPLPPSEVEVLILVVAQPGITVMQAARGLGLRAGNLSVTVSKLVARGLISKKPDPQDRRRVGLLPTARALEDKRRIDATWTDVVGGFLEALSAEERRSILAAAGPLEHLAALAARSPDPGSPGAAAPGREARTRHGTLGA